MTFPSLVVAGAPKCGTSSLHRWLADHPQVCSALQDESRYLLDPASPLRSPHGRFGSGGLTGYAALFEACGRAQPHGHVLEVTPDYLYQETAPRVLASLPEAPVAVFLLRRPGDRVYSHFRFAQNNMAILPRSLTFPDFVAAVQRDDRRLFQGRRDNLRNVVRYSRYADYLPVWLAALGATRIKVYLFEELLAGPAAFMRRVADDVGLDAAFYGAYGFPRVKESIEVRRQWLQRLRTAMGRIVPDGPAKRGLRSAYDAANIRDQRRPAAPADQAAIDELNAAFRPDNDRLAALLGIDLGPWQ